MYQFVRTHLFPWQPVPLMVCYCLRVEAKDVIGIPFSFWVYFRIPWWMVSKAHEFHETCHSVTFYFMKKDSKRCCDTTTPESIHTKDESKRGSAFAVIFGVN